MTIWKGYLYKGGTSWTSEKKHFYIAEREVEYDRVIDFIRYGCESYSEKMVLNSGLDSKSYEYDEQGAIYAKLPRRMYLTLNEEELERVLNSKSYITWIDFIDLNSVAEAYWCRW